MFFGRNRNSCMCLQTAVVSKVYLRILVKHSSSLDKSEITECPFFAKLWLAFFKLQPELLSMKFVRICQVWCERRYAVSTNALYSFCSMDTSIFSFQVGQQVYYAIDISDLEMLDPFPRLSMLGKTIHLKGERESRTLPRGQAPKCVS